jgi:formate/nitrite transporter FocA (FNT family)
MARAAAESAQRVAEASREGKQAAERRAASSYSSAVVAGAFLVGVCFALALSRLQRTGT